MDSSLDNVFKALADPTRRQILDLLRVSSRTTGHLVEQFPELSRFGVMKHIDVLKQANLVITESRGRERVNSINAVPLRLMYERWVSNFQDLWAQNLVQMMRRAEKDVD